MASTELRDLFRSFELEQMSRPVRSYAWNLDLVLTYLMGPPYEPLQNCSLECLTMKSSFLLALASARELVSCRLSAEVNFREGKPSFHISVIPGQE